MSKALKFKMIYNLNFCNKNKSVSFLYGSNTTQLKSVWMALPGGQNRCMPGRENFSEMIHFEISLTVTTLKLVTY